MKSAKGNTGVAAAPTRKPLFQFTYFPFLPVELRLSVFKHVLSSYPRGYRVLRVKAKHVTADRTFTGKDYFSFQLL